MSTYIIYETLNLVNLKIYVGQHNTSASDGYLGTGTLILKAIKKYGRKNFQRITIEYCTSANVNEREEYWITQLSATDKNIGYNLIIQGIRGPVLTKENNPNYKNCWTEEQKRIASEKMKGRYDGENNPMFGKTISKESSEKRLQTIKDNESYKNENHPLWFDIDINKLKELYDSGMLLKDIANYFNVDHQVIRRRFDKFKIRRIKHRKTGHQTLEKNNCWILLDEDKIIKSFKDGKNIKELSEEFKCTRQTITKRLKKNLSEEEFKQIRHNNWRKFYRYVK